MTDADELLLRALALHRRRVPEGVACEELRGTATRSVLREALTRVRAVIDEHGAHPDLDAVERIVASAVGPSAVPDGTIEGVELPPWLRREPGGDGRRRDTSTSPLVRRVFGHVPEATIDLAGLEEDLDRLRETATAEVPRRRRWVRA